jgi:hypothetical protein
LNIYWIIISWSQLLELFKSGGVKEEVNELFSGELFIVNNSLSDLVGQQAKNLAEKFNLCLLSSSEGINDFWDLNWLRLLLLGLLLLRLLGLLLRLLVELLGDLSNCLLDSIDDVSDFVFSLSVLGLLLHLLEEFSHLSESTTSRSLTEGMMRELRRSLSKCGASGSWGSEFLFRGLDLDEGVRVVGTALAGLTEVEVWADTALVSDSDNRGSVAAVTNHMSVSWLLNGFLGLDLGLSHDLWFDVLSDLRDHILDGLLDASLNLFLFLDLWLLAVLLLLLFIQSNWISVNVDEDLDTSFLLSSMLLLEALPVFFTDDINKVTLGVKII